MSAGFITLDRTVSVLLFYLLGINQSWGSGFILSYVQIAVFFLSLKQHLTAYLLLFYFILDYWDFFMFNMMFN